MATVDDSDIKARDIVLAILPIRNNTPDKSLDAAGEILSELLSARFSGHPRIKIVERTRINELLGEIALGDLGPVDSATAARYGRMLGANVLVFGSFGKIAGQNVVTLRLVKVETSQIVGGANEYLESFENLGPPVQSIFEKLIAETVREQ